ncbi:MAG TPA: hypothetical protein VF188_16725 [Longimicrobiales bacterium]
MRIDVRSALILLVTLLLGMALGALGLGALAQRRADRLEGLRRGRGFIAHMERVIRPRDDAQREAIRPYLEAMARKNRDIASDARRRVHAQLDTLRMQLAPLLDAEQRERLDRISRFHDAYAPRGPRRGLPPARQFPRRRSPGGDTAGERPEPPPAAPGG